jgi:DNA-binding SARP family transcriptional activator
MQMIINSVVMFTLHYGFTTYSVRVFHDHFNPPHWLLQEAIQLYQGELLEGWHQNWCLSERERFRIIYLIILDKLSNYAELHQDYQAGVDYGAKILACDRTHEEAYRHLMRLHYIAGNRIAALHEYERCVNALQEDLAVGPSEHTRRLYEQIRADQLSHTAPALFGDSDSPQIREYSLQQTLIRLKQFESSLNGLELQLQQAIQSIEISLRDNVNNS